MNRLFVDNDFFMFMQIIQLKNTLETILSHEKPCKQFTRKIVDWYRYNKMCLNPCECEYMLLRNMPVVNNP